MPTLTKKQKGALDYVEQYIRDNGISPTTEEVRKKLRLKSISTAHSHIQALVKKGFLDKNSNYSRGIEIKSGIRIFEIPLLGTIAAGQPLETVEIPNQTISVANTAIKDPKNYFALRVAGDSMIDEGIFDGDIVVIKRQISAENGQTVVAIVDRDYATLKKLYREKGQFRLQPANQNLLPIFTKELEIRGIVAQIIRNYEQHAQENKNSKIKHFKTLDLFAGIGGIRIGFEKAGFKTAFSNDFEKSCKATYDLNFKESKLVVEDIRKISVDDLPEFDFLLGGFPCQAFSIAGYRHGFEDKKGRGNLFFDIARIIDERRPEGFLLENVKNLKSHDNGRTFKIILETLEQFGYHLKAKVLNSMEYGGVPQNRERIYIVGFKNKEYADRFEFPEKIDLTIKIDDILEKNAPEKYYYNGKPLYKKLKDFIKEKGRVYQWRRQYVRENKKGVCPTLTANMGMGGHNVPIIKDDKGIRKLMPIECARIQGFPRSYKLPNNMADSTLYKQLGNSVTVTVLERIAKKMMRAIEG